MIRIAAVFNGFLGYREGQRSVTHHAPQHLGKLYIQQMRAVQRFSALINALLDSLSGRSSKQTVDGGRSIQHNDRAARPSRTRLALSTTAATGLRACRRSRNSARVGRSAISRSSPSK